jgi:hypothetical protein
MRLRLVVVTALITYVCVYAHAIDMARAPFVITGSSTHASLVETEALKAAGATHARAYCLWRYAQPKLTELQSNETVEWLRANPAAVYAWGEQWLNWNDAEARITAAEKAGLIVIAEAFEGTVFGLPHLAIGSKHDGQPADPNYIGEDVYLAYAYRYTRCLVHRYKGRVHFWQIENELNEAWLAGWGGQRVRDIGGSWRSFAFLTRALTVLHQAVRDEDPTALLTTNLHTDVSAKLHELLLLPGFYLDAAVKWNGLVDIWSMDGYPNMFVPYPLLGEQVCERLALLQNATEKEAFIMETGYPVSNTGGLNFTARHASEYIATLAPCGKRLFYFEMTVSSGITPMPGGYTPQDIEAMAMLSKLSEEESAVPIFEWLLEKGNLHYAETRLASLASSIQSGWGLLFQNGTVRDPQYSALRQVFTSP